VVVNTYYWIIVSTGSFLAGAAAVAGMALWLARRYGVTY